jgi:hypothetical protein
MGNKTTFHKPPLTYLQQLQLLKERGLSIEDENQAMFVLSHVNYYRKLCERGELLLNNVYHHLNTNHNHRLVTFSIRSTSFNI